MAAFRETGKFGLCTFIKQDEALKFERSALDLKTVCDPEFINWENLKASKGEKWCRRLFSTLMSLLCAVLSMVVLTLYQYAISNYEDSLDDLDQET